MSKKSTNKNVTPSINTQEATDMNTAPSFDIEGLEGFEWFEPAIKHCDSPAINMHDKKIMLNARLTEVMKKNNLKTLRLGYHAPTQTMIIQPMKKDDIKNFSFLISTTTFYKQYGIRILKSVSVPAEVRGEGDRTVFLVKLPDEVFVKNQPEIVEEASTETVAETQTDVVAE